MLKGLCPSNLLNFLDFWFQLPRKLPQPGSCCVICEISKSWGWSLPNSLILSRLPPDVFIFHPIVFNYLCCDYLPQMLLWHLIGNGYQFHNQSGKWLKKWHLYSETELKPCFIFPNKFAVDGYQDTYICNFPKTYFPCWEHQRGGISSLSFSLTPHDVLHKKWKDREDACVLLKLCCHLFLRWQQWRWHSLSVKTVIPCWCACSALNGLIPFCLFRAAMLSMYTGCESLGWWKKRWECPDFTNTWNEGNSPKPLAQI